MVLYLKQMEVGLMQNFNYLIGDSETRECAYIDPAWEVDRVLKIAEKDGYRVTKILLTHHHFDHVEGVEEVFSRTGAAIYVHELDRSLLEKGVKIGEATVHAITEGQKFKIGNLSVTVLHTPGHTPGSTCYLVHDYETSLDHLFTGDTLFQGTCGRCDLPGGNVKDLYHSLRRLKQMDPTMKVYPGHDYGAKPVSTIRFEIEHNYTLREMSLEEFDLLP